MDPLSSTSTNTLPADITAAPPPWTLKTKLYLFFSALKPDNREDPILQGLPPGSYNPSETIHPSALAPINGSPQWKGGLTCFVLVRYEQSPVGPYDELIMTPDGFANPYDKKATSGRITNIYVSSRQSVWNGRKNWNTPKHLARFEFIPKDSKTFSVKVSLPDAEVPFFTATVTDSVIPSIPLPSFLLKHYSRIMQPPILANNPPDIEIASDDDWISTLFVYRGRWGAAYIQPFEGGNELYGDGLHYPQIKPFWIGAKFTGSLIFPDGVKISSKVD